MRPIFLERPQLWSALGDELGAAVQALTGGRPPLPEWFALHEFGDRRPWLPARAPSGSLTERLNRLIAAGIDGPLDDCLLLLASTTLDIADIEQQVLAGAPLTPALSTPLAWLAQALRARWGFAAALTLNTACTSAANALLVAARAIDQGRYRRALVIGFETPSLIARQGFGALELTSPSGSYRPFHPERDGLLLGEAWASVVLTAAPAGVPLARLLGGFSACDTSSLTTTREDGSEIERVMRRALESAGVTPDTLALVKLHGTATGANDEAEANGMHRLFGAALPPLCALKPWLGHTLGACGLAETLLLLATLEEAALPPVAYGADALLPLPTGPVTAVAGTPLLLNYFGFGGNNAALVVTRDAAAPENPHATSSSQPLRCVAASEVTGAAGIDDRELKQQLVAALGSAPRRIDRLSLQALLGVAPLQGRLTPPCGLYLAARYPSRPNMLGLLESVCARRALPKPFEFVNSVSNAAGFQVARLLGIDGPNLFIGAGDAVWSELRELAALDLDAGVIDQALLVVCDEAATGDFRVQSLVLECTTDESLGITGGEFAELCRNVDVVRQVVSS